MAKKMDGKAKGKGKKAMTMTKGSRCESSPHLVTKVILALLRLRQL